MGGLGEIRILRVQQEPCHMLHMGGLPDRISQSPLPGRIHGRSDEPQPVDERQAAQGHGRMQTHGSHRARTGRK